MHRRFRFSRDTAHLQRYLDDLVDRTDGREDYIGEWHVHLALDAPPSRVDRRSLFRITRRDNYATDNPILVIVEHTPADTRIRAYGFAVKPKRAYNELTICASPPTPNPPCPRRA